MKPPTMLALTYGFQVIGFQDQRLKRNLTPNTRPVKSSSSTFPRTLRLVIKQWSSKSEIQSEQRRSFLQCCQCLDAAIPTNLVWWEQR
mmetsp:Transcript_48124/g.85871  ORF Transcript_48124/g.85871 Transcript_48124/m.85871 type:complete len:88 (-) Transcript_48124:9-272(-)